MLCSICEYYAPSWRNGCLQYLLAYLLFKSDEDSKWARTLDGWHQGVITSNRDPVGHEFRTSLVARSICRLKDTFAIQVCIRLVVQTGWISVGPFARATAIWFVVDCLYVSHFGSYVATSWHFSCVGHLRVNAVMYGGLPWKE